MNPDVDVSDDTHKSTEGIPFTRDQYGLADCADQFRKVPARYFVIIVSGKRRASSNTLLGIKPSYGNRFPLLFLCRICQKFNG